MCYNNTMKKPLIIPTFIAHRGAPNVAPENTLISFSKAHALGATWVECDVMLTCDKRPIIMHDFTLDRTTNGHGNVADYQFADLEQLDAGEGEEIPSLERFLILAATLGLGINLEIKEHKSNADIIAAKIHEALITWWPDHLPAPLISSAEPACLKAYRQLDSTINMAYIADYWPFRCVQQLKKYDVSILVIHYQSLTPSRIAKLHDHGYQVFAYTVNDQETMRRLLNWGVDSLFTDHFLLAQQL